MDSIIHPLSHTLTLYHFIAYYFAFFCHYISQIIHLIFYKAYPLHTLSSWYSADNNAISSGFGLLWL